jgi:hypothetical protein
METPTESELQEVAKELVATLDRLLYKLDAPKRRQRRKNRESVSYRKGYKDGMEEMRRRLLGR